MIACLCHAFGRLLYCFSTSLPVIMLGLFFEAIGHACLSGSVDSMLHSMCSYHIRSQEACPTTTADSNNVKSSASENLFRAEKAQMEVWKGVFQISGCILVIIASISEQQGYITALCKGQIMLWVTAFLLYCFIGSSRESPAHESSTTTATESKLESKSESSSAESDDVVETDIDKKKEVVKNMFSDQLSMLLALPQTVILDVVELGVWTAMLYSLKYHLADPELRRAGLTPAWGWLALSLGQVLGGMLGGQFSKQFPWLHSVAVLAPIWLLLCKSVAHMNVCVLLASCALFGALQTVAEVAITGRILDNTDGRIHASVLNMAGISFHLHFTCATLVMLEPLTRHGKANEDVYMALAAGYFGTIVTLQGLIKSSCNGKRKEKIE